MKRKLRTGTQLKPRKSAIRSQYAYQKGRWDRKRLQKQNGQKAKRSINISVRIPQLKAETATKVTDHNYGHHAHQEYLDQLHQAQREMVGQREPTKRLQLTPIVERDIDDVAIEQILTEDVTSLSDHGASVEAKVDDLEEEKEPSDEIKIIEECPRLNSLNSLEEVHGVNGLRQRTEPREFQFSPLKARSTEFRNDESPTTLVSRREETIPVENENGERSGTTGRRDERLGEAPRIGSGMGGEMVQGLQRKFERLDTLFIEIAERIDAFDDCSSSFDFTTKLTVDI